MEKKGNKKIIIISIVVAVVIIATIIGVAISTKTTSTSSKPNTKEEQIKEFSWSNEDLGSTGDGTDYITGWVTNLTTNVYQNVTVECILYGENGEELEKVYDTSYFVGANEEFKFFAFIENTKYSQIKSYSINKVEGEIIPKEIIITDNFSISNKEIGSFSGLYPHISYNIKNTSTTDYQEPITIVNVVKDNSLGMKYVYYNVIDSLNHNATTHCFADDNVGIGALKNVKYSFENCYVILGNIAKMENMKDVMVVFSRVTATPWEKAQKELDTMGLKVEKIEQPNKAPKGNVFKQEPEIGTKLKAGSTVKVYVSTGEE